VRRKPTLPLVWSILIGLFLGTYLGFLLGTYIPFFNHAWNFQLGPFSFNLGFMSAQFNLSLGYKRHVITRRTVHALCLFGAVKIEKKNRRS